MTIDLKIAELSDWKIPIKDKFLVAGPCSLESEEQIVQTAMGLAKHGANVLRAGIWKPRTRPGSFQGIGAKGLEWLKNASVEANLPVVVEVATTDHVEKCLKYGIDILWIGARTTTNPFLVQIIAESLRGVDIGVMVKNPINPELELWLGSFERLNWAGITKLMAVHRGFSVYESKTYRNMPYWQIPLALRTLIPNIPIICDPSHICGNVELLFGVAQKAIDLNYDGLMIESHINPKAALSDAKQQITPEEFGNLIKSIKFSKPIADSKETIKNIGSLQKEIDEIDNKIIELQNRRIDIKSKISFHKNNNNIPLLQLDGGNGRSGSSTKKDVIKV